MKNIFKFISTILMAILILILVWVLVSYYREEPTTVVSPNNQNGEEMGSLGSENDPFQETQKPTVEPPVGNENPSSVVGQNDDPPMISDPNDPLMMESTTQTSDAEKQHILSEIDQTLMELLEVVDKVQPIDETRLESMESGVPE